MLEKIKNFWANPYYAPLTEPLKNVDRTVEKSVSGYTEAIKEAFNDKYLTSYERDKSRISRIYANITADDGNAFGLMNGVAMVIGGAVAGLTAGGFTWAGMAASGIAAKIGAVAAAGIAAATVGAMATPLVLVAGIAAGAVVVGAVIGVVPGLIDGTVKAYKHHHALKNPPPPAAPAAAAAQPTVQQIQNETISRMVRDFAGLPLDAQSKVIEHLRQAGKGYTAPENIIKAVEALDDNQRVAFVEALEKKLGSAFDAVAQKKAAEAGVLDEDISVQAIPTKLKRRNTAAPEGSPAG
jgi:hypothetical protein